MNKKTYKNVFTGRSLYLVDIENIVGASEISESQVVEAREALHSVAAPGPRDQFYLASSHHNAAAAGFGWPGAQKEFKSGPDGADFMIIKKIIEVGNCMNFDHVYIASGDGCMAYYVDYLASLGVRVTILANRRGLSHEMRYADAEVLWLDSELGLAA